MMKTLLSLIFPAMLFIASIGHALPSKLILVRHGEEPKGDEGTELSERGWERAQLLPHLFRNENLKHLIALKPHKKSGSIRSIQTLQPISEARRMRIQIPFDRDQVAELVKMLKNDKAYDGKVVLVAWQQESLPGIAHGMGARKAPVQWGRKTFDRYWVLKFQNGNISSFENLPQRLLPDDDDK